jgi:hypothetical protein
LKLIRPETVSASALFDPDEIPQVGEALYAATCKTYLWLLWSDPSAAAGEVFR